MMEMQCDDKNKNKKRSYNSICFDIYFVSLWMNEFCLD